MTPTPHPNARPGNRNAAKPAKERRVVLAAQRVDRATLAKVVRLAHKYGGVSRVIDAGVALLPD